MTHPVAAALAPHKQTAQQRSKDMAVAQVAAMTLKLEAAGWNLDVVAPMPDSRFADYKVRQGVRQTYTSIFHYDETKHPSGSRRPGEPLYVRPDHELAARYAAQAYADAGFQYEAYVAKVCAKVGPCDGATYDGRLWQESFIVVRKGDQVERWKTQQIVNISSLGKLFNQWPTRKVK